MAAAQLPRSNNIEVCVSSPQLHQKAPNLIHTSYYKNFFLLRTEITVGGERAQVGVDDRGWLTLHSRKHDVGVSFDSLVTDVNDTLQQQGLRGVSNYWCEEVPLFELRGTSPEELEKFLGLEGKVWKELAAKISTRMKGTALPREPGSATTATSKPSLPLHVVVEPQLYLIIPDYENMDGKPVLLTRANFDEYMTVFGKSILFDFGAIFRVSRTNPEIVDTGPDTLAILQAELHEVVNWYALGQALLVPDHQLMIIRQDNPNDTVMCRNVMLSWWWKNAESTTWLSLVQALAKCGQYRLASSIATHYGLPLPQRKRASPHPTPTFMEQSMEMDEVTALESLIIKLRRNIEERDRELAKLDRRLQRAEKEKNAMSREINTLNRNLSMHQLHITQLEAEKEYTLANALRVKQFEMELLRQANTHQIELQRQSIDQRESEIYELNCRLQAVERELREANQQIPVLQERLERVTAELTTKSTELDTARQNRNDGWLLLDMANKVLDNYLMQKSAANISYNRYKEEIELQNTSLKQAPEMNIKEYEAFHSLLETSDPELGPLFQKISSRNPHLPRAKLPHSPGTQLGTEKQVEPRGNLQHEPNTRLSPVFRHVQTNEGTDASIDPTSALSYLQWEKRCRAPQALVRGSAAVHGPNIFILGEYSTNVHRYNLSENRWIILPAACPHINPGLAFIDDTLTAFGGQWNGNSTAKVVSLKNRSWVNELPQMKYSHSYPSVHNHDGNYIIVAAGSWEREQSMIEVYSIHTTHWFNVIHLPTPFYSITSTMCLGRYVIMDGAGTTYSMDIAALLSFATSLPREWTKQATLPVLGEPTLATFNHEIICVSSEGLHKLSQGEGWVRVHNTFSCPSLWSKAIVCVVGERFEVGEKLVVVGGYNPSNHYANNEVSVAQ